eukprot:TRINITY_DN7531_c0_g1_i3.p1 TRINITY_DN7531_c0_g1~~TRINITY_DN7531_c0_g1_i3.p1  ORF type:complete len:336 (-),score=75.83 TRINITY_DN7531_c0_g1_i3:12-1019(-)
MKTTTAREKRERKANKRIWVQKDTTGERTTQRDQNMIEKDKKKVKTSNINRRETRRITETQTTREANVSKNEITKEKEENKRESKSKEEQKKIISDGSVVGRREVRHRSTQVRTPNNNIYFNKTNGLFLEQTSGKIPKKEEKILENLGKNGKNIRKFKPRAKSRNQIWKKIKKAEPEETEKEKKKNTKNPEPRMNIKEKENSEKQSENSRKHATTAPAKNGRYKKRHQRGHQLTGDGHRYEWKVKRDSTNHNTESLEDLNKKRKRNEELELTPITLEAETNLEDLDTIRTPIQQRKQDGKTAYKNQEETQVEEEKHAIEWFKRLDDINLTPRTLR